VVTFDVGAGGGAMVAAEGVIVSELRDDHRIGGRIRHAFDSPLHAVTDESADLARQLRQQVELACLEGS
jgi:hypothetical protein